MAWLGESKAVLSELEKKIKKNQYVLHKVDISSLHNRTKNNQKEVFVSLVLIMNFDIGNICEQGYLIQPFFNKRESTKTDVFWGFFGKGSMRVFLAWLDKQSSEFPTLLKLNIFTNFS